ncbi:MAG: hypothetical protein PHY02_02400 [Phycisphaerae bacterium]|nr:hypothetical protein [Phycisphaerae bacterium]
MDEGEKREVEKICWKTIFIAVVLVLIGVAVGHVLTVQSCPMMKPFGGPCMKAFWDKGDWGRGCNIGRKADTERRGFSKCSERRACLSDPNKAGCPMTDKKADKSKKN